jgi:type IV secretory pathway TrbD component
MAAPEIALSTMRVVYKALHRPLTLCGVDRRLFFLALLVGVAAFNLFFSFLAGCMLFAALYACARWSTVHDPQFLQVVLRASKARRRYDAAKHAPFTVEWRSASWSK